MGPMMLGYRAGGDISEAIDDTKRYADYDHLLRSLER